MNIFSYLYQGLLPQFLRQMLSWSTFLYFDQFFRDYFRKITDTPRNKDLPIVPLLGVCFCVGVVNTAIVYPVDTIKTIYQQFEKSKHAQTGGIIETFHQIRQSSGLKSLYAGYQVRIVQYMIQSLVTMGALERFERRLRA
eukprot:TRINITY_DN7124_c0_g2_i3.p1 TRINITY_DN7124_c0_g2~~TRINITY_DN7124_c0_g2_i3.p1  ORF type:complete len:140 (-),score=17.17 TRINITY_DN7124_c0_g2_i3:46-465(-)